MTTATNSDVSGITEEQELEFTAEGLVNTAQLFDFAKFQHLRDLGLTIQQFLVLICISQGINRNNRIAEEVGVERPSVSALLERLEKGGFITREMSLEDRREVALMLTPKGVAALHGRSIDHQGVPVRDPRIQEAAMMSASRIPPRSRKSVSAILAKVWADPTRTA